MSCYWANEVAQHAFGGRPFVMTVGSAHPPNAEGIVYYLTKGGVFSVPPIQSIAICGGVSNLVFSSPEYQKYLAGNSARVHFFADIGDDDLWALKQCCHGVLLPLRSGGGSNLKTAEALALGKWTIATQKALRGFEAFSSAEGVIMVDNPAGFRRSVREVLRSPPLEISAASRAARDGLYWDRCFADSGLSEVLLGNGSLFSKQSRKPALPCEL
jgi:glycosyltransferase involved in cell wall biosynthesis